MARESIHQPFEIVEIRTDSCPLATHGHNFFELVYIVEGTGRQTINNNQFRYSKGHLFLVTPEDVHLLEVEEETHFFFLRFNRIYLQNQEAALLYTQEWTRRMEFILAHASHRPGCIVSYAPDKQLIPAIVAGLIQEQAGRPLYHNEVVRQLVNTLITVVARNIAMKLPAQLGDHTATPVLDIIGYIQENIYSPPALRAAVIARHFHISQSYLGRYFKKHTNENLQDYITNYKLKLVETRLKHSDLRINEIAAELSFTDESHLTRLFRKHRGMNPSAFRRQFMPD
ncbi:AraC family transcriptional regulator [Chitinophaga qingshengii]|uniref:Helix-turn-helix transcriptional regulator n=1 Tax=Chitinophaga qingshengii TaxID=1569794 RepID=A0ABR7TKL6_9BACT|nr:AraC family transcriptional regulator [Chitinophaga qingshengii]MBC9930071.1 helix-turn-helix transcriptional regulator [Chitinophaga qingshengii]